MDQTSFSPTISCVDQLPDLGTGIVLNYEFMPVRNENWEYVDIRDEISIHENRWFKNIQNWHNDLSRKFSEIDSNWWFSPGSRLIYWESYHAISFDPAFFLLGAISLLHSKNKSIVILNATNEFQQLLEDWLSSSKRDKTSSKNKSKTANIFEKAKLSIVFSKNLGLKIAKSALGLLALKTRISKDSDFIICSLAFNLDQIKNVGDHYFGRIFDSQLKNNEIKVLWVYLDIGGRAELPNAIMKKYKRNYCFLNSYTNIFDILTSTILTFISFLKFLQNKKNVPMLVVDGVQFNYFTNKFYYSLILEQPIFDGLLQYFKFKRLLKNLPKIKHIIYPYEEHISERSLLKAIKIHSPDVRSIGFSHASLNQGHLYLRRPNLDFYPRPNFIFTTSDDISNFLANLNVPRDSIYSIGSPRYFDCKHSYTISAPKRKRVILAIFSFGFEFKLFSQLISLHPEIFKNFDLRLRGSFHSWRDDQLESERILKYSGIDFHLANGDLETELLSSDIVIFDITTAGIQASLLGIYVIRFALNRSFHTKHLFDTYNQHAIKYCLSIELLFSEISHFLNLLNEDKDKYAASQRNYALKVLAPPQPNFINNFFTNESKE